MTPPEPQPLHQQTPPVDPHASDTNSASAPGTGQSRRAFLFKLSLLLNGAVGIILAVPIVGYLLGPTGRRAAADSWVPLGPVNHFPEGETRLVNFRNPVTTEWDGQTGDIPCWVRRIAGKDFQVFAINCAHLGCPVRWFSQSKLFLCPCHGGVYYADGSRASGPPERGLFEYDHKIVANTLMIKVGKMPTLANRAKCGPAPLVHIEGTAPSQLASVEKPSPAGSSSGCASCQG